MRRPKSRMNHVMWDAFASMDVGDQLHTPFVKAMTRALKRNIPGTFGGWRVIRAGGKRGKRSR